MAMRRSTTVVVIEDSHVVDVPVPHVATQSGLAGVEPLKESSGSERLSLGANVTQDVYQEGSGIQKLSELSHVESLSLIDEPGAESLTGLFDAFASDNRQRQERIEDAAFAVASEIQTGVDSSLKRLHGGDFKSSVYPIVKPTVQGCLLSAVSHLYEGLGNDSAVCKDDSIEHALSEIHSIV